MQKIKVVLLSTDTEYINLFETYLLDNEYNNKLEVEIFTDFTIMSESVKNSSRNILLTEIYPTEDELQMAEKVFDRVVLLSEMGRDFEEEIFKYQPFDRIVETLLMYYYDNDGRLLESNNERNTSTVAFASANGGTGKTLLSLMLGKVLSKHSRKVFYLSMEQLLSASCYLEASKPKSSELFYFLKDDPYRLVSKFHKLKDTDAETGIDFFPINMNFDEVDSLNTLDVENLVKTITSLNEYDFLIIDMDSRLNEINSEILRLSNDIFWVLESNETSFMKTGTIMERNALQIEIDNKKMHYIVNKFGENLFAGHAGYNFNIESKIKFNPEWLNYNEKEKVLEDSEIGHELLKSLSKISLSMEVSNEK
ncbi:AAA family ATPase [Salinicoccus carnicancri]|uniref:AAA family ATPase n=1 Tax=Salinicoccus carnicancri TaxID=558170 RepID=UPI0002F413DE|nr:AAA family ATPase [Salinicoccus carnicancri]